MVALPRSHVPPEVASAAASPLQTNKTLREQKGPVALHPSVHPAGSRGMPGVDVLASCFFVVGPHRFWGRGVRLGFTLVLPCLAARPAGPGRSRPSRLACSRIAVPTAGQGLCFPAPRPHSSRSAHSLQGEGDLRGCGVAAGSLREEEVPALVPGAASSFPPRGAGTLAACVRPGPGWSLPGISRVSSSYRRCPGLAAHRPGWRVWEHTPPPSHGCPEQGNAARLTPSCPPNEHPLAPACFPRGKPSTA